MQHSWLALGLVVAAVGLVAAQSRGPATAQAPDVTGRWTGNWSAFNPAQSSAQPKEQCKQLDANVQRDGEIWKATFEGDCGRPYKYTITMEGRQVGNAVMFKGTTDLGPKDGGVYDWIGRATDKEFIGFYTSADNTGVFNLSRAK